eukprot:15443185-Alexandrium_andersonii.AAC.1
MVLWRGGVVAAFIGERCGGRRWQAFGGGSQCTGVGTPQHIRSGLVSVHGSRLPPLPARTSQRLGRSPASGSLGVRVARGCCTPRPGL